MEILDNFCLLTGVLSIGVAGYEAWNRTLVGRDAGRLSADQIRKFLPYDVLTYLLCGILLALLGLGGRIPFFQKGAVTAVIILLSIVVIALNVYFANRILGKRN